MVLQSFPIAFFYEHYYRSTKAKKNFYFEDSEVWVQMFVVF